MADSGPLIVVAAALLGGDGTVLVQQRPPGKSLAGLWEFPGGKLERGEAPDAALVRELREELGIDVAPDDCVPASFATGAHASGAGGLLLLLYVVRRWSGLPRPMEATALRWATHAELGTLPMPPADRPLVAALATLLD